MNNNPNQSIQSQQVAEMNHSYYVNNNNDQIEEGVEFDEENSKDLVVQIDANVLKEQEIDENPQLAVTEVPNHHEPQENIENKPQDESELLVDSDNLNQPVVNEFL